MSTLLRTLIKFLIGIVIFVGLPLMGWGVKDAQGFITYPARFGTSYW